VSKVKRVSIVIYEIVLWRLLLYRKFVRILQKPLQFLQQNFYGLAATISSLFAFRKHEYIT